jgi:hypothetical protein
MAFFGMAYVGPQSALLQNRKNFYTVAIFKLQEFQTAFERVAYEDHSSSLSLASLSRVLDAVFHGPPPELERQRVDAALAARAGEAGALTLEQFLEVISALQATPLEVNSDDYAHYTSFEEL